MKRRLVIMKRKALSILLALSMIMTFMPAMALTAFADTEEEAQETAVVETVVEEAAPVVEEAKTVVKTAPAVKDNGHKDYRWDSWSWFKGWNWNWDYLPQAKAFAKNALTNYTYGYQNLSDDVNTALETALAQIDDVKYGEGYDPFEKIREIEDAAIESILTEVKEYATDAVEAYKEALNGNFDAEAQAVIDEYNAALADIAAATTPYEISTEVFFHDFGRMKAALDQELNDKVAKETENFADADLTAVENAKQKAHLAYVTATTYEELAQARNNGMKTVELAIAPLYDTKVLTVSAKAYGSKGILLSWNDVGATSYSVYANQCGKKYKFAGKTSATSFKLKKIGKSKLKKHRTYKFYVVANNGYKSQTVHFVTAKTKGKYANVKSVYAKSAASIERKASTGAGASYKMPKHKKHLNKSHGVAFTYRSDNTYVATVSANGTITANHCGTANILVHEMNGQNKTVKVTVDVNGATELVDAE